MKLKALKEAWDVCLSKESLACLSLRFFSSPAQITKPFVRNSTKILLFKQK